MKIHSQKSTWMKTSNVLNLKYIKNKSIFHFKDFIKSLFKVLITRRFDRQGFYPQISLFDSLVYRNVD